MISLLLTGFIPVTAQAAPGPQDPAELEAFIDGVMATQMAANHIPGAVFVVVRDGEVFFSKGYGYADLNAQVPVDPERTLFRPGSVSKLFTWTAVMQIVERGLISMDEDVNTYLDFEIPATFPEPITLRHLFTHTPGFEDRGDGLFKLDLDEVSSLGDYLKQNIPARVYPPGQIGAYSNYGASLAAYIVERVSGIPFYEYLERNIFTPLGMERSTFRQPLPEHLAPDMSGGYNYSGGRYVQGRFEYVVGYPAGSMTTTGADVAKFMIAHLQNGGYGEARILNEDTAGQMHSQLFTHDPRQTGMAYGFYEGYLNGQRVLHHGGDTFLFHSMLYLLPEQNVGFFISTNGASGSQTVEAVTNSFFNRYYPAQEAAVLSPTADFGERAALYAGEYYLSRGSYTTMEKLLRLAMPVSFFVNADNQVVLSFAGNLDTFVEIEPGLLVDRNRPDSQLVMKEMNGQVHVFTSGPFAFLKTPWYGAGLLHMLVLGGGVLLFLGTVIGWGIAGILRWRRGEAPPAASSTARWTAVAFGLIYVIFLLATLSLFIRVDPAYGVPYIFFGIPKWVGFLEMMPLVLVALAVVMAAFTGVAWTRRFWSLSARVFYTFLTIMALVILWSLWFWNLLL